MGKKTTIAILYKAYTIKSSWNCKYLQRRSNYNLKKKAMKFEELD